MFKKILIHSSFLSLLLLTGCGGGGSSSSNDAPPQQDPNTAPTLSGQLSIATKATQTATLIVDAQDEDGDSITVTIASQPDWLTHELENGQVTFNFEPGFFDIGVHELAVSVSDGTASTEYTLSVQVEDNPDAYSVSRLPMEKIAQNWEYEDGSSLHLYENSFGLYINNEQVLHPIRWKIVNGDTAEVYVYENGCKSCGNIDTLSFQIVYEEGDRARFFVESFTSTDFALNTVVSEQLNLQSGFYYPIGKSLIEPPSTFDLESGTILLAGDIFVEEEWRTISTKAQIAETVSGYQFTLDTETPISTSHVQSFTKKSNLDGDSFFFDYYAHSLEVHYSADNMIIFKLEVIPQLSDGHPNVDPDDYYNLPEFLDTSVATWIEVQPLTIEESFDLSSGSTYISRFSFNNQEEMFGLSSETVTANTLTFDGSSNGRFILNRPSFEEPTEEIQVQLVHDGSNLSITAADDTTNYQFVRNIEDELMLITFNDEGEARLLYPFFEKQNIELTAEELNGEYLHTTFYSIHAGSNRYMTIDEEELSFELSSAEIWRQNPDFSLDLIRPRSTCSLDLTYEECLQRNQDELSSNSNHIMQLRRVQLVKIEGDKYYFTNDYFLGFDGGFLLSSLRVMEKVSD